MSAEDGHPAGAPRPENPFASPSTRPAPMPRAYPSDYAAAPPPGGETTAPEWGSPTPGPGPAPQIQTAGHPTGGHPTGRHQPVDDGGPVAFPGSEHVDRRAVLGGPGYTSAVVRNDPLAVAAMVLGVLAVVPGIGLAAVICGHLALRRLDDGYAGGRGLAVAGLALGYTLTALWVLLVLAIWGMRTA
jgi:hypothetical protein